MPCQEDALNERSSIPPVSVTMHAENDGPGATEVPEPGRRVVGEELLLLLPQAAATSVTRTAAAIPAFFGANPDTSYLPFATAPAGAAHSLPSNQPAG
jgi:hypothetical protein